MCAGVCGCVGGGGCPVPCRMFTSIFSLNPLDAIATSSGDNQKCLQAMSEVPWLLFITNDQKLKEAILKNINYLLAEHKQREDTWGPYDRGRGL